MDAHDLFHQLTRGVRFTKKQEPSKLTQKKPKLKEEDIKIEKIESLNNDEKSADEQLDTLEENEQQFQFLDGACASAPGKKRKLSKLSEEELKQNLEQQSIIELRKVHRISVMGKNIPPPITTFEELRTTYNVTEQLVKNLASCNYPEPTPIQMQAIPILLQNRPLMACAPTGSGKTIAFLTPIINDLRAPKKEGFRAIVLAPTRELAHQIYRECIRLSEKSALKIHIISKVNQAEQKFGPKSSKKFDILISTPNRVRFLLQQEPPLLELKSVEWIIIDEADRLMEEGQNNFKDQLDDILVACSNSSKKIALFSATYTVPVAKWALKNLKNLARVNIGQQNTATELVEQELLFVGSESGKLLAVRDLVHAGLKPPVLVFVQSKDRAKQLFEELLYDGINVDVIHADRTQQQRDNCVRAFREGNIWVLICTELMGRGIDFKGVNLVINYDFPPSTISYIHRIGRTGRAGRPGKAITFFTQNDTPNLRSIAQIIKNSGGKVPDFMLKMKKTRKTEQKKLANFAPKRDDISTKLRPEAERQNKLNKVGQFVKRRLSTEENKSQSDKENAQKKLRKIKKLSNGENKQQKGHKLKKNQQLKKGRAQKTQMKSKKVNKVPNKSKNNNKNTSKKLKKH